MEKWKQGSSLLVSIFLSLLMATAKAGNRGDWDLPGSHDSQFLLKSEVVTKSDAGELRIFRGHSWNGHPPRFHIGVATLEPSSQSIPQYIDADLTLDLVVINGFIVGEAKVGWIHEDELVESQLKAGAILRIPAGSIFYFVNNKEHQLQIFGGVEPIGTELTGDLFTPFYIGGGELPPSALAGFDISTLTTAFNVSTVAFRRTPYMHPPLVSADRSYSSSARMMITTSFLFGEPTTKNNKIHLHSDDPVEAPDAYNIYDHDPNFKNDYGYTIEVNEHDYSPLKHSDISVYLVNISAGSILAPHVNPRATEYGIVIAGSGTVEIVNPNGTKALKAEVRVGDVFWVPRFYPFAYVAGREGPLVIVGYTTSARKNRAQFLVGKGSTLSVLVGKELAAGFGVTEEELDQLVKKQEESVILPGWE